MCFLTRLYGSSTSTPRFSVEFWGVDKLKEKQREYSSTVFYAGSCVLILIAVVQTRLYVLHVYVLIWNLSFSSQIRFCRQTSMSTYRPSRKRTARFSLGSTFIDNPWIPLVRRSMSCHLVTTPSPLTDMMEHAFLYLCFPWVVPAASAPPTPPSPPPFSTSQSSVSTIVSHPPPRDPSRPLSSISPSSLPSSPSNLSSSLPGNTPSSLGSNAPPLSRSFTNAPGGGGGATNTSLSPPIAITLPVGARSMPDGAAAVALNGGGAASNALLAAGLTTSTPSAPPKGPSQAYRDPRHVSRSQSRFLSSCHLSFVSSCLVLTLVCMWRESALIAFLGAQMLLFHLVPVRARNGPHPVLKPT